MCRPVRCRSCGDTTWAGCGQHVDQVMSRVPHGDRCTCRGDGGGSRTARSTGESGGSSLLSRLRRG